MTNIKRRVGRTLAVVSPAVPYFAWVVILSHWPSLMPHGTNYPDIWITALMYMALTAAVVLLAGLIIGIAIIPLVEWIMDDE